MPDVACESCSRKQKHKTSHRSIKSKLPIHPMLVPPELLASRTIRDFRKVEVLYAIMFL